MDAPVISRIHAHAKAPPIHWWGNAFYRLYADFQQLVIVLRLPWWGSRGQLMLSWRQREGWRRGWKAV